MVTLITKRKVTTCRWFQNTVPLRMLRYCGVLVSLNYNFSNPKVWVQCLHKTILRHITPLYFQHLAGNYRHPFFSVAQQPQLGQYLLISEASRSQSHTHTHIHTNTIFGKIPLEE